MLENIKIVSDKNLTNTSQHKKNYKKLETIFIINDDKTNSNNQNIKNNSGNSDKFDGNFIYNDSFDFSLNKNEFSLIDEANIVIDNLKYDIASLEISISEKNEKLKSVSGSYIKLKQDCFFIEKEQELFNQEIKVLTEKFKDCNWKINKDYCNKILNSQSILKPITLIVNICEIFLFTLNFKDTSWNAFKDLINSFSKLKTVMSKFAVDNLTDEQINRLMELWMSSEDIEMKLIQKFPEAELIFKWLIILLELKIKSNAAKNSKEKNNSILNEMSNLNNQIKETNSEILKMKLNFKKTKYNLENLNMNKQNKIGEFNNYANFEKNNHINKASLNRNIVKNDKSELKSNINDYTLDNNNLSYELDEKTAMSCYKKLKKDNLQTPSNNFQIKDESTNFIMKTIKLDHKSQEGAIKPLPSLKSKSIKAHHRKQPSMSEPKNNNFINKLPSFKTKNNQNVLNLYSKNTIDNLSNITLVISESNEKSLIECNKISSQQIKNIQLCNFNEDNSSQFSKKLEFSPNETDLKRSIISYEDKLLGFNLDKAPMKKKRTGLFSNNKNKMKYVCNDQKLTIFFC